MLRSSDENSSDDSRGTRDSIDSYAEMPVKGQKHSFSRSSIEREYKAHTHEERLNDKRKYNRDKDYTKAKEKEKDIKIHYVQQEPAEFSFKLDTLTVSSAVMFLEKYNQMIREHDKVPHLTRFLSQSVQEELRCRKN